MAFTAWMSAALVNLAFNACATKATFAAIALTAFMALIAAACAFMNSVVRHPWQPQQSRLPSTSHDFIVLIAGASSALFADVAYRAFMAFTVASFAFMAFIGGASSALPGSLAFTAFMP